MHSWIVGCVLMVPLSAVAGQKAEATAPSITDDLVVLHQMVETERQKMITQRLLLTKAEKTKFWPLYRQYQADLSKVADARYALIAQYAENYDAVNDQQAIELLGDILATEDDRKEIRKKHFKLFQEILPGKKVVRFYQIDHKIELALQVELTRQIPLIK